MEAQFYKIINAFSWLILIDKEHIVTEGFSMNEPGEKLEQTGEGEE